ncbi:uncharacterized protein [Musca autumnalis]|uniref:uncharacterized protein n=1 Tax=Musca autumnalis TaxID=221902 RepID=UPI003CF1EAFF
MPPNNDSDIVNPNEHLDIPAWINVEYFKDIVAKDEPNMVKIKKFTPTAAIPPGENFTSVMLRLHFELEMKDGSVKAKTYIFKTMLDDEKGGKMINDLSLFPKEMEMYSTYLPAFEKLYKDVGWNIQFAPKCLLTEKKDNRINFLFEDLACKKFKNIDRLEGCDMDHMKCVLKKLAEFHAASAVYEELHGAYGEDFQYGFVDSRHGPGFIKMIYDTYSQPYKKAMTQWGMENADEYIKKYFPTYEQYWKCALATLKQKTNQFNVLNHADFWSSNIMFSYTENKTIQEALMVDFQLCKWGSPAEDLLFFITISAAADIRLKEFDNFVAIYHKRLVECLKILGYKKPLPSLRLLQQDMYDKKNTFYAFFACINHLPIVLLPSDKDANIESYSRPDEVGEKLRMKTYTNPRFVAIIKEVYKFYSLRGLFNFEDYDEDFAFHRSPETVVYSILCSKNMSENTEIINPNENLHIPEWINAEYFHDIVKKDEPDFVAVKKFTPTAAIPPGENFTSVMLRLHLDLEMKDGSSKSKTYVFKTMLEEDKGGAIINKLSLFPKEMEMYGKYLPAFEELYKAVGWNIQLSPNCLYTEKKGNQINFVFEDLNARNFKNIDRLQGCDMAHMTHILRKIAEFHAASAVYEELHGPYPEDFQYGFVDNRKGDEFLKGAYNSKVNSYTKAMAEWGLENAEEYIEKFPTCDQYLNCAKACLQQSTNSFNVLCHGDFWSSNIMFSYLPNGEINETILLDFQICKWGSPAEDLLFFLTISPAAELRIKEFDHFVEIYHKRLVECLKVLGYKKKIPALCDLQCDMLDKKNSFYAFFACFNHLPAIMLPSDKDSNIHSFSRTDEIGEEFRRRAYTNPLLVSVLKELYPFYHNKGIFNFEDYDEN